MPTISAKLIKSIRQDRICGSYRCNCAILKGEPIMRIYGSAATSDPPYVLYICLNCARKSGDPKIQKALKINPYSMVNIKETGKPEKWRRK